MVLISRDTLVVFNRSCAYVWAATAASVWMVMRLLRSWDALVSQRLLYTRSCYVPTVLSLLLIVDLPFVSAKSLA